MVTGVEIEHRSSARFALVQNIVSLALLFGVACTSSAADIFSSVGPDGTLRYSTQALDSSYTLMRQALQPPSAAIAAGKVSRPIPSATQLQPLIERIAMQHGIAPALVQAVIAVESAHNPFAVSPKGARGAMQLMPATAAQYGLTTKAALSDPERNIDAGVRHLKGLLDRYDGNVALALAAYNAGSGAVAKYGRRIPPYAETMLYVPAVMARTAAAPPP